MSKKTKKSKKEAFPQQLYVTCDSWGPNAGINLDDVADYDGVKVAVYTFSHAGKVVVHPATTEFVE